MTNECRGAAARLALANEAAIETQLVGGRHADAEYRGRTVNGDAPCSNPILYLATRGEPCAGQNLLKALAFCVGIMRGAAA